MLQRMVELKHFAARSASLAQGPVTITRYVVAPETGEDPYCIYSVWKLKTRMQNYNAAVVALKTWKHFEAATTNLIRLRSDVRAEIVHAIWQTYPESTCAMIQINGLVLKGHAFESWWQSEGTKLPTQLLTLIDLATSLN